VDLKIAYKKKLLFNIKIVEFLSLFYLSENIYKLKRVQYEFEVDKKANKVQKINLHLTAIKSVAKHFNFDITDDELTFLFGSQYKRKEVTKKDTIKNLRNKIVHECDIKTMEKIIEDYEFVYKPVLKKFIEIF